MRAPPRVRAPRARSTKHGLLAGALVVVFGAAAFWFFTRPAPPAAPSAAPAPKSAAKIAEATPQIVTNKPEKVAEPEKPAFVKRPGALQLNDGTVLTFPPPSEGEIRKVYAYGHMYECDHLGNFRDVTKRQLFHTAFEANFLALACAGRTFIPAFLTGLDQEEVKKMLVKNYQPIGDETEEEMQQLKNYDDMRCAALEYMEQGGNFDDFVNDIAKFEEDQKQAQAVSLREILILHKQGNLEEARNMVEAADVMMKQKGCNPVRLPNAVRKDLGLD